MPGLIAFAIDFAIFAAVIWVLYKFLGWLGMGRKK